MQRISAAMCLGGFGTRVDEWHIMFSLNKIGNLLFKGTHNGLWKRRLVRLHSTPDGKRLLHIGCGEKNSREFINLDAQPMPHVHILSNDIFLSRMIPDVCLDVECDIYPFMRTGYRWDMCTEGKHIHEWLAVLRKHGRALD